MTVLVVARTVHAPLSSRRQLKLGRVRRALLMAMSDHDSQMGGLEPLMRYPHLISEVLLDYAALVRGRDRATMLEVLEAAGALSALTRGARRRGRDRRLCLEAISVFPSRLSIPLLREFLEDREENIRLTAATGLAAIGAPLSLKEIEGISVSAAVGARTSLLRQAVLADPASARTAVEADALSTNDCATILDSLGLAGDYPSIPLLIKFQQHQEPVLRASAVIALGHLMHPDGHDAISRALSDSHWCVRAAAARAVGLASFEDLIPKLETRLRDPIWSVRLQAADSLKGFGEVGPVEHPQVRTASL
jgi:HEAT repeat protein